MSASLIDNDSIQEDETSAESGPPPTEQTQEADDKAPRQSADNTDLGAKTVSSPPPPSAYVDIIDSSRPQAAYHRKKGGGGEVGESSSSNDGVINIEVSRQVFTEDQFQKGFEYNRFGHAVSVSHGEPLPDDGSGSLRDQLKRKLTPKKIGSGLLSLIPILTWLPKYKFKENLIGDIIGGITVGISRIPIGKTQQKRVPK